MPHLFRQFLAPTLLGLLLTGCGSGSSDTPATNPPTAAFTAPTTADAYATIVFDASASSASDGTALHYFWDFGADQHGGGKTIARTFGTGGDKVVTLTVTDGAQRSARASKTITIAAPPAPVASIAVHGVITTLAGVALDGVTVAQQGGTASAISDALGKAEITLGTGVPLTLKLSKAGYAEQVVTLQLPASTGADASFAAVMRTRDGALTLADSALGGSLTGRDGASVALPANALVRADGTAVSGPIEVAITPVDVTQPAAGGFPGSFAGIQTDGNTTPIVSFGVAEYVLTAAGQPLQLAPGKSATIEIPIYGAKKLDGSVLAVGDSTPLWSLDENTGLWVQEGFGTVVASTASPSGLALRATVSHFSWWNSDLGFAPYSPQPRCVYDTDSGIPGGKDTFATATICNMLAEMDRGTNSNAKGLSVLASAAPLPRLAGFARAGWIPIAGGVTMTVPPGVNVALNATALNGTWAGRTVVNGATGTGGEVLIKMRPVVGVGSAPEVIALPFDAVRGLQTGQTAHFSFSGSAQRYTRITASQVDGLTGRVRLLQGSAVLATADFDSSLSGSGPGQILTVLPVDGSYNIEVTGLSNTPGVYHLRVELIGSGPQNEALTPPFDVTRTLPELTSYRGTLDIAAPATLYLGFRGARALLRVTRPDGTVAYSAFSSAINKGVDPVTVSLTAPGSYVYEVIPEDGRSVVFRLTGETTPWLQVGPGLDVQSTGVAIDLLADRNGKPVLVYFRRFANGTHTSGLYLLRRWNGSAWESVGSDLSVDYPCSDGVGVSVVFDIANNPLIAYSSVKATGGTFTSVRKFTSDAWQPIGPDEGVLPNSVSPSSNACQMAPVLQLDAADVPVVAYRADQATWVQRYDGVTWKGIATPSGDTFDKSNGEFDLRFDASGRLHLVVGDLGFGATIVRRLNSAPSPAWETVGPNGGRLPEGSALRLNAPRLRFDTAGNPVIATVAYVGSSAGGDATNGTAVYRYDGNDWVSSGVHQAGPDSVLARTYTPTLGFTLFDDDAIVSWGNHNRRSGVLNLVVQRNTATAWSPIGAGLGEVPQFSIHALTDIFASSARLAQIGTELYMALVVVPPYSGSGEPVYKLTLMRKVAE